MLLSTNSWGFFSEDPNHTQNLCATDEQNFSPSLTIQYSY